MQATSLIALSVNAMPDDVAHAMRAGFAEYCANPNDFKQFLTRLVALAKSLQRP